MDNIETNFTHTKNKKGQYVIEKYYNIMKLRRHNIINKIY